MTGMQTQEVLDIIYFGTIAELMEATDLGTLDVSWRAPEKVNPNPNPNPNPTNHLNPNHRSY